MTETTKIGVFRSKEIRKTIHNNEWWFVIEDVVFALTDSKDPRQYIRRMKQHDLELKKGWVQIVHTLSIETAGELTDEWKNRQINEQRDYSILTAEISKATFNMTPSEYKKFKRLKRNSRHSIR